MAGMSSIRVLLVDDDPLVREGLAMMLDGAGEITVVGQAGDGDEIPGGTSAATVDVVLMDLRMRRQGGLEDRRLREQAHPPEVIVLTTFDSRRQRPGGAEARRQRLPAEGLAAGRDRARDPFGGRR